MVIVKTVDISPELSQAFDEWKKSSKDVTLQFFEEEACYDDIDFQLTWAQDADAVLGGADNLDDDNATVKFRLPLLLNLMADPEVKAYMAWTLTTVFVRVEFRTDYETRMTEYVEKTAKDDPYLMKLYEAYETFRIVFMNEVPEHIVDSSSESAGDGVPTQVIQIPTNLTDVNRPKAKPDKSEFSVHPLIIECLGKWLRAAIGTINTMSNKKVNVLWFYAKWFDAFTPKPFTAYIDDNGTHLKICLDKLALTEATPRDLLMALITVFLDEDEDAIEEFTHNLARLESVKPKALDTLLMAIKVFLNSLKKTYNQFSSKPYESMQSDWFQLNIS